MLALNKLFARVAQSFVLKINNLQALLKINSQQTLFKKALLKILLKMNNKGIRFNQWTPNTGDKIAFLCKLKTNIHLNSIYNFFLIVFFKFVNSFLPHLLLSYIFHSVKVFSHLLYIFNTKSLFSLNSHIRIFFTFKTLSHFFSNS